MHIVAGLSQSYIVRNKIKGNTFEKIDELMSFGTSEFFIGYVPNYWYENLGFEISPNGRQSAQAQFTVFDEFKQVVEYIKSKGGTVLMTLNANSYNNSIWNFIQRLIDDSTKAGIDGLIVSDLGVLEYLKSIDYKGLINVSTIFNIYNSETIKFLNENYKINRFIFPREVTLKEILTITSQFSNLKFEVFGAGDKCIISINKKDSPYENLSGIHIFTDVIREKDKLRYQKTVIFKN